ncbi:MAG: MFS transporter [Anaerolineales bacterium]|nr:MFS transporter [Anaerolineales bacterium]
MQDPEFQTEQGFPGSASKGRHSLRNLPRNVWVVTITSFFNDISSEMLLNLMPLFLFNVLGVRTSVIGLIEGIAETTASLVKIVSGWISDRIRKRKALAVCGYALSTLAKPFLYFASSWGAVLGVRFADRMGKGLRTAPRDALVADTIEKRQRGLAFGLHRAGDTAGAVLGLLIALVVVLTAQRETTVLSRSTFQTVVLLSLIPAALAVGILAAGAKDVAIHRQQELADLPEDSPQETVVRSRDDRSGFGRPFRYFLGIVVLFTLGNSSDAFLVLRAQTAGLTVGGLLGMLITFNLVYALISTPAGALSDRVGRHRLLIGGWVFYALVYLGFSRAAEGWQAWGLMTAYGIYYGLTDGVAKAFVADLVPEERRGTAYGLYNAAIGLTALPASFIAGLLWQGLGSWHGFGPGAPFLFGAVLAIVASAMLTLLPTSQQGHAENTNAERE